MLQKNNDWRIRVKDKYENYKYENKEFKALLLKIIAAQLNLSEGLPFLQARYNFEAMKFE